MINDPEHRQHNLEKLKLEGKIRNIIFDALFICDIEYDKMHFESRPKLRKIIEDLIAGGVPQPQARTHPITDKMPITKETIEVLHARVMKAITDDLSAMGISDAEKLKPLSDVVFKIIQYEKSHRDEEKRLASMDK